MTTFMTLVRRELGAYFNSATGYLILAAFSLMLGLCYTLLLHTLNGEPFDEPLTEVFFTRGLFWLVLLLASPLITMRTFALEKHTGTYETLMTAPVSDLQVVLAKWSGSMIFHLLVWTPVFVFPFILRHYAPESIELDRGPLWGTFIGICLLGFLYMAMGVFASSVTSSQIVGALIAFVLGLSLFLVSTLTFLDLPLTGVWEQAVKYVSMIAHMRDFSRGIIDSRFIVYYLSLTFLFLYLTFKVVESRRWK